MQWNIRRLCSESAAFLEGDDEIVIVEPIGEAVGIEVRGFAAGACVALEASDEVVVVEAVNEAVGVEVSRAVLDVESA